MPAPSRASRTRPSATGSIPRRGSASGGDALSLTPPFVERHPVYCAVAGARVLGFYALSGAGATRELEHFWVLPAHIGRGVGTRMFVHAVATLRADGARECRIASDPYAERFYLRMGARRVGEWPSTPRGRTLPLLVLEVGPASRRRV